MPQTRKQAASAASGDLLARAQSSPSAYTVKKGWDHWLLIGSDTVITRQLQPHEYLLQNGKAIAPYWFAERLKNELAVGDWVRAQTTIPVPKSRLYTNDAGLLHLETERVTNGVCLMDIMYKMNAPTRQTAVRAVDAQLRGHILPQLQKLCGNRIGSVDETIPVFPPHRVFEKDRRSWPRVTSSRDEFVLCHTCLNEQNIYVEPETYNIVAIVGWECAGYFPPYFEIPSWLDSLEEKPDIYTEAKTRELAFFGLTADDLVDDSTRPAQYP